MENIIINRTNVIMGMLVTLASYFLGQYWFLFAAFLALNVIDYVTGCIKATYFLKNANSSTGAKGVAKKVLYWLMIATAFLISAAFQDMGVLFGIELGFVVFLGYLTLATYIVNEIRSIIENFYEMNVNVPKWLVRGLDIVEEKIELEAEEQLEKK